MTASDNTFVGGAASVEVSGPSELTLLRNSLQGASYAALTLRTHAVVRAASNSILPAPGANFITCSGYTLYPVRIQDFANNYWGTTDLEEISARIYDGYDEIWVFGKPTLKTLVEFEPILKRSVSTEKSTIGGLKGMY